MVFAQGWSSISELQRRIAYAVVLAVGVLVYLVADSALVGALLPALYSSWGSLSAGWWVWRTDADRTRGRITVVFYVATALWLAGAGALASLVLFAAAEKLAGVRINMDDVKATLLTLLGGVILSTTLGFFAAFAAAACRVQVWVHPRIRELSGEQRGECVGQSHIQKPLNYAIFVLATSVAFPILALGCLLVVHPASPFVLPLVFLGGPALALVVYAWLATRIIAASPRL